MADITSTLDSIFNALITLMKTTAEIDPQLVKQLREKTNAGFMDCKRALWRAAVISTKRRRSCGPKELPALEKKLPRNEGRRRRFLYSPAREGWRARRGEL